MESVIIAAPTGYEDELRTRFATLVPLNNPATERYVLDSGASRVCFERNDTVEAEFEPEDMVLVRNAIRHPTFYTVEFRDIEMLRSVLQVIADDPNLIVDNDHGVTLPGDQFVALLKANPSWDWRIDPCTPHVDPSKPRAI